MSSFQFVVRCLFTICAGVSSLYGLIRAQVCRVSAMLCVCVCVCVCACAKDVGFCLFAKDVGDVVAETGLILA